MMSCVCSYSFAKQSYYSELISFHLTGSIQSLSSTLANQSLLFVFIIANVHSSFSYLKPQPMDIYSVAQWNEMYFYLKIIPIMFNDASSSRYVKELCVELMPNCPVFCCML